MNDSDRNHAIYVRLLHQIIKQKTACIDSFDSHLLDKPVVSGEALVKPPRLMQSFFSVQFITRVLLA
jgi:hypothetical protein